LSKAAAAALDYFQICSYILAFSKIWFQMKKKKKIINVFSYFYPKCCKQGLSFVGWCSAKVRGMTTGAKIDLESRPHLLLLLLLLIDPLTLKLKYED
jgi:hypothetical protein